MALKRDAAMAVLIGTQIETNRLLAILVQRMGGQP
jgi:hypothetical protein